MHRITGGANASGYAQNILFDLPGNVHFLSLPRNRFNLSRFVHEMKPGDIVVVPRADLHCQDQESFLTVEIRTSCGSAMRIQGNMTAAHLREIISASNV